MIHRRVDRGQLVKPIRKSGRHRDSEHSVFISGCINTLEESETGRIRYGSGREGVDGLYNYMRVANDDTLCIDNLWSGVVVGLRIHEVACLNVLDLQLDVERLKSFEGFIQVERELEFARWHVGRGSDDAHWRRIT